MIAFAVALLAAIALIARVHSVSYPHIDDVLRAMDEADKDRASRERMQAREKNRANKCRGQVSWCAGDGSTPACLFCE